MNYKFRRKRENHLGRCKFNGVNPFIKRKTPYVFFVSRYAMYNVVHSLFAVQNPLKEQHLDIKL